MAKPKNQPDTQLQELYVEPPLLYRLFPTFLKNKEPSEKALQKAAQKAQKQVAAAKPQLPIADLLPSWLVEEVRRRDVGRRFTGATIIVVLLFVAFYAYNWRDVTGEEAQLTVAQTQLEQSQASFARVAPLVDYSVKVRDAAEFANENALAQLNGSAAMNALLAIVPGGVVINDIGLAYGSNELVNCSAASNDNPFNTPDQGPGEGIGCISFAGSAADARALDELKASVSTVPGFLNVNIVPGSLDESGRYLFTGTAILDEQYRIEKSGALVLDVSNLPDTNPLTAVTRTDAIQDGSGTQPQQPAGGTP